MTEPEAHPHDVKLRELPGWVRTGSVLVRAVHLTSCAALLGEQLFVAGRPGMGPWWLSAALSGVLLLVVERAGHPGLWRLLAGWATLLKLLLLGLARALPALATALLLTAFVVAVLGAHLPRRWRHRQMI